MNPLIDVPSDEILRDQRTAYTNYLNAMINTGIWTTSLLTAQYATQNPQNSMRDKGWLAGFIFRIYLELLPNPVLLLYVKWQRPVPQGHQKSMIKVHVLHDKCSLTFGWARLWTPVGLGQTKLDTNTKLHLHSSEPLWASKDRKELPFQFID